MSCYASLVLLRQMKVFRQLLLVCPKSNKGRPQKAALQ
jgi:hypothetical protein